MIRPPPISTRTHPLFPSTPLFRSNVDAACAQEVAAGLGDEAANQPLDATFSDYVVDGARSVSLACGKGFDRTLGRANDHAIAARKEWTEDRSFQAHCHHESGANGLIRTKHRPGSPSGTRSLIGSTNAIPHPAT